MLVTTTAVESKVSWQLKLNELGKLIVHEVYDNFKEEKLRLTVRETAETFVLVHEINTSLSRYKT